MGMHQSKFKLNIETVYHITQKLAPKRHKIQ
uniref:Uncharacterized protein n=1 Tax=Arundo donax TaxID=35708 RepID=A0A0A8ZPL5_ARUDO